MPHILITGPESSGKTYLAENLAREFNGRYVPEYAREYLEGKDGYAESDLLKIAHGQWQLEQEARESKSEWVFYDTGMEVISIWSQEKYGRVAKGISDLMDKWHYDFVILCEPNIPWEDDPMREHPRERDRLFIIYKAFLSEKADNIGNVNSNVNLRLTQAKNLVISHFQ